MTITKQPKKCQLNIILYLKEYHTLQMKDKIESVYQKKEFTAEEGKKIREIFEEFDDEDDGDKTIH